MKKIRVGDSAPDFTLHTQEGESLQLTRALEHGPVVLYFYPKDDTPVCTKEACLFRDTHPDFTQLGATVLGISSDPVETHRAFAGRHELPFTLLSDPEGRIRRRYGVPKTLGLMDGRVTYVIDQAGVVREIINSALDADKHVRGALAALRNE